MDRVYKFTITGISPLIMHHDDIEWADKVAAMRTQIKERDKANFSAGDDRCPPDTWKGYCYSDGEHICLPTDNLRTCLMKAGAKVTLKNQETFKKASQSGIVFDNLYAQFLCHGKRIPVAAVNKIAGKFSEHSEAVLKLGFRLLAKRAKVGSAKHVRVRPMFSNWSATGTFLVVDDRITENALQQIWEIAGLRIGVGDWRPDSPQAPGPYGRFSVVVERMVGAKVA